MFMCKLKLQFCATFAIAIFVAASLGCTGFFQNPTATTLTVGPSTFNLNQGGSQQMTATATYNDVWTSSDDTIASVSSGGLVTGVSVGGPVTITGQFGTVSGSATANVVLSGVTAITISPLNTSVPINGTSANFTASATVSGSSQPVDVTSQVTWVISSVSGGTGSASDFMINGQGTTNVTISALSTATSGEIATVNATYSTTSTTINATTPAKLTVQ
jgi:hypothetical protein